nr:MAG TPA: hypothetical protein [Caudoviricetes sp.]
MSTNIFMQKTAPRKERSFIQHSLDYSCQFLFNSLYQINILVATTFYMLLRVEKAQFYAAP